MENSAPINPEQTSGGDNSSEENPSPEESLFPTSPTLGSLEFKPLEFLESSAIKTMQLKSNNPRQVDDLTDLAEEIADDMLHILERMKKIESRQDSFMEQLGGIQQLLHENKKQNILAMDTLRDDLLGERKAFSARSTFNALLPTLDALRLMYHGLLDTPENQQIRTQVYAVTSSLSNIIQSLGFVEFHVEPGMPFDPAEMESLGLAEGNPNEVVSVVRSGYKVGSLIVRPCGVILAQPPSVHQS